MFLFGLVSLFNDIQTLMGYLLSIQSMQKENICII